MAASGTQITALHWETLDTEGPTRTEYQANWAAMDTHIHDGRGAGAPVRTITNATVPAASGDVRVNVDAFQWWGTSLHTAVDLSTAQTVTASKTFTGTVDITGGTLLLPTATVVHAELQANLSLSNGIANSLGTIVLTAGTWLISVGVGMTNTGGAFNIALAVTDQTNSLQLRALQLPTPGSSQFFNGGIPTFAYTLTGTATIRFEATPNGSTATAVAKDATYTNASATWITAIRWPI